VEIPAPIVQALIDHARGDYPNEMCGILSGDAGAASGGSIERWYPTRNELASRFRYSIHGDDKLRILSEIDDADRVVWGIAHSHVASPAIPSSTDIGESWWFPDAIYLLVSLAEDQADPTSGSPSVRAWRIAGGQVFEVEIRVTE
jgi:proteasome lid subunit RPN8/RPN11